MEGEVIGVDAHLAWPVSRWASEFGVQKVIGAAGDELDAHWHSAALPQVA